MALLASIVIGGAIWGTATAKEISFSEGTNFGISISPDELTIIMDLQGILWKMPVEGGTAIALTTGQQPEVREAVFSPDGTQIVFQGFDQGYFHLWTINADGSGLKQLTTGLYDDREPSWNADGKTIVFASDRSGNYDIWEIELSSGKFRQLTNHPDDDAHPQKSLDGLKLLHTREIKRQYSEIILVEFDNDGGRKEMSLMKETGTSFFRPTWDFSNRGFSYISHNDNDIKLNYVIDANSHIANRDALIIDQGDIFPFKAHWTEQGVYFTSDGQIKYRKVRSQERRNVISANMEDISNIPFRATINSVAPNYQRKKHDFDHQENRPVRGIGHMDVSPEDNMLVYTALGDMWLQAGEGPAINVDDEIGHVIDPTWSPNGGFLAYVGEIDGQMDIWIRDIENNSDRRMTNDKNREYKLSWSRDGKYIAFLSTRGVSNTWGRSDLKVMDVEFGSTNVIDKSLFTAGRPAWSMNGEYVMLASIKPASTRFREGMHSIKKYNVETGRSSFLEMPNNIGLSTRDGSGPVMSPDGKKMTYISEGEIRTVYVNIDGEITGSMENRCTDLAHMPRWARNSQDIYYLSGSTLKTCNILSGQKDSHRLNAVWNRKVAEDKTIHVEKLFDGVSNSYQNDVDVFISGNRITNIAPHGQNSVVGTFYDYSNKTMIPGLMAGHTHQTELLGEKLGRNWLAYGITSVRDPGTNPYKSLMRKETWDMGRSIGPRMFYAGWLTGGPRVYYGQSYNALNEKALRHEVERARALDYDMFKSYVRLPDEFQQILVEEGHKMGIPVSSHEISPAVQNGMDSVEHMGATSRRGYSPKFSSLSKSYQDVMNIISDSGLFITPTATLETGYYNYMNEYPEYLSDIKYRTFLDQMQRDGIDRSAKSTYNVNEIGRNPSMLKSLKIMHDRGANVAAGTDSPFIPYGIALHFEIFQFVDAGISNFDALRAATLKVAQNIGVADDLGTLEVGKIADMVIVDGDPLDQITDIRKVDATIKDGNIYTIRELTIDRTIK
jgi:Tol biopolymer transport system component/imidazolonepropionase-like amidohydrolase